MRCTGLVWSGVWSAAWSFFRTLAVAYHSEYTYILISKGSRRKSSPKPSPAPVLATVSYTPKIATISLWFKSVSFNSCWSTCTTMAS